MSDHRDTIVVRPVSSTRCGPLHRGLRALVYIALIAPTPALAQSDGAATSRFAVEPRFGMWWIRRTDDAGTDYSGRPGSFSTLRLTTAVTPRLRAVASVAYARLEEARISTLLRDNGDILTSTERQELVPVTAGFELDIIRSRTVVSLGLDGGAVWSRSPITGRTGPPPFDTGVDERSRTWSVSPVILPSITVRRAMSSGLDLSLSAQAFWDEGTFERGDFLFAPVVSAGIRWSIR